MVQRWEVHFSGSVQGVGFRYTTRAIAGRHDVTGYVRNLPDGRVRLVAEGETEELTRFVEAIKAEMGRHIDTIDVDSSAATAKFSGFEVRH